MTKYPLEKKDIIACNIYFLISGVYSITITYNPNLDDESLRDQMASLMECNVKSILVDNNSENINQIEEIVKSVSPGTRVIRLDKNHGIGKALNIGIAECLQNADCLWILTLDQDSVLSSTSFKKLSGMISGGNLYDADIYGLNYSTFRFSSEMVRNHRGTAYKTNAVITSGMITRRKVYESLKYCEKLFMYFVDNDFCARAVKQGYTIVQCYEASINHNEGERLAKGGRTFYVMRPNSIFYVARNSIFMFFRHKKIKPFFYSTAVLYENIVANYYLHATITNFIKGMCAGIIQRISKDKNC